MANLLSTAITGTLSTTGNVSVLGGINVDANGVGNTVHVWDDSVSAQPGFIVTNTGTQATSTHTLYLKNYGSGVVANIFGTTIASKSIIASADGGEGLLLGTLSNKNIFIGTNAAFAMVVDNSQRVGIGTTSPTNKLTVEDTIGIKRAGVGAVSTIQQTGTGLIVNAPNGYHPLVIQHNSSELFRFTNGGNVGIGTTSPDIYSFGGGRILTVSSTSTYSVLVLSSGNANSGGISMGNQTIRRAAIDHLDGSHLAFYTNGTNSGTTVSERMRITSGGNVGIGTTNPATLLHVANASVAVVRAEGTATNGESTFQLLGKNSSGTARSAIFKYDNSDLIRIGVTQAIDMRFETDDTERMRITAGGNVGIGTTAPGAKLTVSGAGVEAHINNGDTNTLTLGNFSGGRHFIKSINLGVALTPLTLQASSFTFDTGNVGIGTTSPAAKLHIAGGTDASIIRLENTSTGLSQGDTIGAIQFYNNDTTDDSPNVAASIYATAGPSGGSGYLSFRTKEAGTEGAAATATMTLTNGGNVGIGTTSPVGKLDVALLNTRRFIVTYDDSLVTIKGANDTGAGENLRIIGDNLIFNTSSAGSGSERMRITIAGNVLINTTGSPTAGGFTNTTLSVKQLQDGISGGGLHIEQASTDNVAYFGFTGSVFLIGTSYRISGSYQPIAFTTNGSERLRITNAGNVGIGTTAPTSEAKVHIVGQGTYYGLQIDCSLSNTGGSDNLFLRNTSSGNYVSIGLSANDSDGQHHRAVLKAKKDPVNAGTAAGIFQIDVRNTSAGYTTALTANALANIGIGTISPTQKLDVATGNIALGYNRTATNSLYKDFAAYHSEGNVPSELSMVLYDGSPGAVRIKNTRTGSYNSQAIHFDVHEGGVAARANAMIINYTGNVGIGTTSPVSKLHIETSASNPFRMVRTGSPATNFGYEFGSGDIGLYDYTNSTYRYYITSAGNVGIGTTSPSDKLTVSGNARTSGYVLVNNHSDNTLGYRISNTSGSAVSAMFVNSANALVIGSGAFDQVQLNKKTFINGAALGVNVAASATAGRIDASNDIVAYSSSDERLKENIAPIENALDKVKSLTGVEFDWKPEYKDAHGYEGHDTGIIAQQVEAVMPSAVRTNDTGFLAVRYEKLIGLLVEANKELAARVEELEKKLG